MNLENFPTSPAAKRMLKTVSPIYDNAYVAKWIFQVMGLEIDEAWQFIEELRLQAFPETATWGIIYWEQRYYIPPDESRTIEERRQRVVIKRGKRKPINPARIEQFVKDVTGRQTMVTEQNGEYVFYIAILPGESEVDYQYLIENIKNIKPSHLSSIVLFQTDVSLVIQTNNQHHKFGYPLTGTIPDTNTIGAISDNKLNLGTTMERHSFEYPVAGTEDTGEHPEVNTIGAIRDNKLNLDTTMEGHPFGYPVAGTKETGEHPEINIVGDIKQGSILPSISAISAVFDYQLCGDTEHDL